MIDQLYPYVLQTVQALIINKQLPLNINPDEIQVMDNWKLVDTLESVIMQEVCFLFEYRVLFTQIEIKVHHNHVVAINVIQDLNKKITYHKE